MKILIANRSEIALRVIRTATELGIDTVVGYADADAATPFTRAAGEAYSLGGDTLAETYMNGEKLIDLARATGADAVHPGYGFLSESPEFAEAVAAAGLTWIGPSPKTLRALGDKIGARQLAERVGVQPVPGISQQITGRAEVEDFVARWGYPIVTKKADGGGGRGITIIRENDDLDHFFQAAGPAPQGVFVEKYLENARHVETQCMRDARGNFAVVSTRDCSVQRRNQKLIEEAPAPGLTAQQEATLERWSRALFEGAGFVGLGTCEFLVGDEIFFLEVNPRLQVEHTVSEEVTGLDLVAEQIRIARGESISPVPPARGHSFEFRITCEDPARDMQPSQGAITGLTWPLGHGVRVETGVAPGDVVASSFDSMLAKIIVTAPTREAAIARSLRALGEFRLDGLATPVQLYRDIITHPDFAALGYSTRWFEESFLPAWNAERETRPIHHAGSAHPPAPAESAAERQTFTIEIDGRQMTLTVPKALFATGTPQAVRPQPLRRAARSRAVEQNGEAASGDVRSPIQAIVVRVVTEPGAVVAEGDLLVVLESMKMESYVYAPLAGRVERIAVQAGSNVAAGTELLTIAPERKE